MKQRLSYADINLLSDNIVEVTIDEGIEITLELMEEYDNFLTSTFKDDFGVLVNKVHKYTYAYEVQLSIASQENLKAIAVVNYHEQGKKMTDEIYKKREIDGWNLESFSGLELGWQSALEWLKNELTVVEVS